MNTMSRVAVPYLKGVLIGLSIVGFMYIMLSLLIANSPATVSASFANDCIANGGSAEFCGCIDNELQNALPEAEEADLMSSNPDESYRYQALVQSATDQCSGDTRVTIN